MSIVSSHSRPRSKPGGSWARGPSQYADRIERARNVDLVATIARDVKLRRAGRDFTGLCPFHREKTPSFTVVPAKGFFHCFGCGAHGDAIEYVRRRDGVDFLAALTILAGETEIPRARGYANPRGSADRRAAMRSHEAPAAGVSDDIPDPDRRRDIERASRCWKEAVDANGTIVETYFRQARGLDVSRIGGIPPTIRFHPALPHPWSGLTLPARLDLIQGADGRPCGVQRVWLAADGSGKADVPTNKAVLGDKRGGTVRFTVARRTLVIGEGSETVLSPMVAMGIRWDDNRLAGEAGAALPGFWCGIDIGNLAGRGLGRGDPHPDPSKLDGRGNRRRLPTRTPDMAAPGIVLPPIVRVPVYLRDRDGADPLYTDCQLARAVNRSRLEGRSPRVASPPAGMDFNDWWRATQGAHGDV